MARKLEELRDYERKRIKGVQRERERDSERERDGKLEMIGDRKCYIR